MESRPVIVASAVLALIAALVVTAVRWGEQPAPSAAGTSADTHILVVRTVLVGPRVHYIEGAQVGAVIWPEGASEWYDALRSEPVSVGEEVTWTDVPTGTFDLVGEVYPCNGNCGELGLPTDTCAFPLRHPGGRRGHRAVPLGKSVHSGRREALTRTGVRERMGHGLPHHSDRAAGAGA